MGLIICGRPVELNASNAVDVGWVSHAQDGRAREYVDKTERQTHTQRERERGERCLGTKQIIRLSLRPLLLLLLLGRPTDAHHGQIRPKPDIK